jgi:hypothetical protein
MARTTQSSTVTRTTTETVQGQNGGLAVVRKFGRGHMRTIGSRGGQTVLEQYGTQFYSLIGRLGAHSTNGGTLSKTALLKTQRAVRRLVQESN